MRDKCLRLAKTIQDEGVWIASKNLEKEINRVLDI